MTLRTTLAALLVVALASCGSGNDKAIPLGEPVAPNFSDNDPVDFGRQSPSDYPVHGIDAARFQTSKLAAGAAQRREFRFHQSDRRR